MSRRRVVVTVAAAMLSVALGAAVPGAARAQDAEAGSEGSSYLTEEIARYAKTLKLRLSVFELGGQLDESSVGMGATAHLSVDPWARRGRVRLGAGRADTFALRLDADIVYERGGARTSLRMDLSIGGSRTTIQLPDVRLTTSDVLGERAYEATVPIVSGRW